VDCCVDWLVDCCVDWLVDCCVDWIVDCCVDWTAIDLLAQRDVIAQMHLLYITYKF